MRQAHDEYHAYGRAGIAGHCFDYQLSYDWRHFVLAPQHQCRFARPAHTMVIKPRAPFDK